MRLLLISLALLAPLALAYHDPVGRCDGGGVALGVIEVSDGTPEHTFYVDDRNYLLGAGVWTYQESNGIFTPFEAVDLEGLPSVQYWWTRVHVSGPDPAHDLQRGGSWVLNPYVPDEAGLDNDEICVDDTNVAPDTLIF